MIGLFVPKFPSITFPSGLIFTSYSNKYKRFLEKLYLDSHHWNFLLFIQLEAEISSFLVAFAHLNVVERDNAFWFSVLCFFKIVERLKRVLDARNEVSKPFL